MEDRAAESHSGLDKFHNKKLASCSDSEIQVLNDLDDANSGHFATEAVSRGMTQTDSSDGSVTTEESFDPFVEKLSNTTNVKAVLDEFESNWNLNMLFPSVESLQFISKKICPKVIAVPFVYKKFANYEIAESSSVSSEFEQNVPHSTASKEETAFLTYKDLNTTLVSLNSDRDNKNTKKKGKKQRNNNLMTLAQKDQFLVTDFSRSSERINGHSEEHMEINGHTDSEKTAAYGVNDCFIESKSPENVNEDFHLAESNKKNKQPKRSTSNPTPLTTADYHVTVGDCHNTDREPSDLSGALSESVNCHLGRMQKDLEPDAECRKEERVDNEQCSRPDVNQFSSAQERDLMRLFVTRMQQRYNASNGINRTGRKAEEKKSHCKDSDRVALVGPISDSHFDSSRERHCGGLLPCFSESFDFDSNIMPESEPLEINSLLEGNGKEVVLKKFGITKECNAEQDIRKRIEKEKRKNKTAKELLIDSAEELMSENNVDKKRMSEAVTVKDANMTSCEDISKGSSVEQISESSSSQMSVIGEDVIVPEWPAPTAEADRDAVIESGGGVEGDDVEDCAEELVLTSSTGEKTDAAEDFEREVATIEEKNFTEKLLTIEQDKTIEKDSEIEMNADLNPHITEFVSVGNEIEMLSTEKSALLVANSNVDIVEELDPVAYEESATALNDKSNGVVTGSLLVNDEEAKMVIAENSETVANGGSRLPDVKLITAAFEEDMTAAEESLVLDICMPDDPKEFSSDAVLVTEVDSTYEEESDDLGKHLVTDGNYILSVENPDVVAGNGETFSDMHPLNLPEEGALVGDLFSGICSLVDHLPSPPTVTDCCSSFDVYFGKKDDKLPYVVTSSSLESVLHGFGSDDKIFPGPVDAKELGIDSDPTVEDYWISADDDYLLPILENEDDAEYREALYSYELEMLQESDFSSSSSKDDLSCTMFTDDAYDESFSDAENRLYEPDSEISSTMGDRLSDLYSLKEDDFVIEEEDGLCQDVEDNFVVGDWETTLCAETESDFGEASLSVANQFLMRISKGDPLMSGAEANEDSDTNAETENFCIENDFGCYSNVSNSNDSIETFSSTAVDGSSHECILIADSLGTFGTDAVENQSFTAENKTNSKEINDESAIYSAEEINLGSQRLCKRKDLLLGDCASDENVAVNPNMKFAENRDCIRNNAGSILSERTETDFLIQKSETKVASHGTKISLNEMHEMQVEQGLLIARNLPYLHNSDDISGSYSCIPTETALNVLHKNEGHEHSVGNWGDVTNTLMLNLAKCKKQNISEKLGESECKSGKELGIDVEIKMSNGEMEIERKCSKFGNIQNTSLYLNDSCVELISEGNGDSLSECSDHLQNSISKVKIIREGGATEEGAGDGDAPESTENRLSAALPIIPICLKNQVPETKQVYGELDVKRSAPLPTVSEATSVKEQIPLIPDGKSKRKSKKKRVKQRQGKTSRQIKEDFKEFEDASIGSIINEDCLEFKAQDTDENSSTDAVHGVKSNYEISSLLDALLSGNSRNREENERVEEKESCRGDEDVEFSDDVTTQMHRGTHGTSNAIVLNDDKAENECHDEADEGQVKATESSKQNTAPSVALVYDDQFVIENEQTAIDNALYKFKRIHTENNHLTEISARHEYEDWTEFNKEEIAILSEHPEIDNEQTEVDNEVTEIDNKQAGIDNELTHIYRAETAIHNERIEIDNEPTEIGKEQTDIHNVEAEIEDVDYFDSDVRVEQTAIDDNKDETEIERNQTKIDKGKTGIDKKQHEITKEQTANDKEQIEDKLKTKYDTKEETEEEDLNDYDNETADRALIGNVYTEEIDCCATNGHCIVKQQELSQVIAKVPAGYRHSMLIQQNPTGDDLHHEYRQTSDELNGKKTLIRVKESFGDDELSDETGIQELVKMNTVKDPKMDKLCEDFNELLQINESNSIKDNKSRDYGLVTNFNQGCCHDNFSGANELSVVGQQQQQSAFLVKPHTNPEQSVDDDDDLSVIVNEEVNLLMLFTALWLCFMGSWLPWFYGLNN